MQDTSAGVCGSFGVVLRWVVVSLFTTAALSCGSEEKPPEDVGGLVLNLESDLTMPKDIDEVAISVVSEAGEMLLNEHYSLGPGVGRHLLPYQVRLPSKGIPAHVKAQIVALKRGIARMERTADVDLPMQRWGAVSLPVNYLCDGTVDEMGGAGSGVMSSCGAGQTCDQGRCISSTVADVPDQTDDAGGGGGAGILADLSQDDNCLNVVDCMSDGLTVQVDTSTCSFEVPVNASGFVNVALKMAQQIDGFCNTKGCWLPLKFGIPGGWSTNGTTVFLPPAVCFEDPASARFTVTVSDACQTFWPSLALCGVAAVQAAKDDAKASSSAAAASATASTVSGVAAAIACGGPASRPTMSCGRQTRTCDTTTGKWSAWSTPSAAGECALGQFTLDACPGGMPQVCGPTCSWIPCCNPATCFGGRCVDGVCCGNGVVEGKETCEGDCTSAADCDDGNPSTTDVYTGSVATCNAKCTHTPIIANDDGRCAPGVGAATDNDCQKALCDNGILEVSEKCDGNCPTDAAIDCDDGFACTVDTIASKGTCSARCMNTPVRNASDGCCAPGQTTADDPDCLCGNKAIDPGEFCDGNCPTKGDCNDGNACTADSLVGSAKDCSAHCVNAPIVQPGDNCCAPKQTHDTDTDCPVVAKTAADSCTDDVIDTDLGETCVGVGCPTSCDDPDPTRTCVGAELQGSAAKCNAKCVKVITIANNDGCCPPGTSSDKDNDCLPMCGNGVLDTGEKCEPNPASPMTPTCLTDAGCKALNPCFVATTDQARCITQCTKDPSCTMPPLCGDRFVQAGDGEKCEPHPLDGLNTCPTANQCKAQLGDCYTANQDDLDQCRTPCTLDPAKNCNKEVAEEAAINVCGDGIVGGLELCDTKAGSKTLCETFDAAKCTAMKACTVPNIGAADICSHPCKVTDACEPPKPPKNAPGNTETSGGAGGAGGSGNQLPNMGMSGGAGRPSMMNGDGGSGGAGTAGTGGTVTGGAGGSGTSGSGAGGTGGAGTSGSDNPGTNMGSTGGTGGSGTTGPGSMGTTGGTGGAGTTGTTGGTGGSGDTGGDNSETAGAPAPTCGNGKLDPGEMCDSGITSGPSACPTSCTPKEKCGVATVEGTACAQHCVEKVPQVADNCCPDGEPSNDPDCKPVAECGNGMLEAGEECDTTKFGPTTPCKDDQAKCIMQVPACTSACAIECLDMTIADCTPDAP